MAQFYNSTADVKTTAALQQLELNGMQSVMKKFVKATDKSVVLNRQFIKFVTKEKKSSASTKTANTPSPSTKTRRTRSDRGGRGRGRGRGTTIPKKQR